MRRLVFGLVLVAVWVLLWEGFTWGQVAAGVVVAAGLMLFLPTPTPSPGAGRLTFRPLPALRLFAWFVWQFLLSNFSVARAVLFPRRWVSTGVVHVELRSTSPTLAALVSNITALTPGMQPVDGRPDGSALDVHVLSLRSDEAVRRVVQRLEDLVLAAFEPSDAADVALGAVTADLAELASMGEPHDGAGADDRPEARGPDGIDDPGSAR